MAILKINIRRKKRKKRNPIKQRTPAFKEAADV
jgi:hypothetical protein